MKCPQCNHEVKLTWKKYWSAPLGKHACPECKTAFRLKNSFLYYAAIISAAFLLGLLFPLLRARFGIDFMQGLLIYLACCLVIIVPLDRWIDDKWRGTIKAKSKG
ncbi:MAG: hypothetical protein M0036_10480 [Desulfobacteraceae bacterium]|nr:hypothetical protein [Desulfobacteraceae bacterium]